MFGITMSDRSKAAPGLSLSNCSASTPSAAWQTFSPLEARSSAIRLRSWRSSSARMTWAMANRFRSQSPTVFHVNSSLSQSLSPVYQPCRLKAQLSASSRPSVSGAWPGLPCFSRYRIVAIGTIMPWMVESLPRLRAMAWPLLIGLILGGAVMLLGGSALFWALVAAGLAALLIAQFLTFQEPILRPLETADDSLAALPPMTRVLLDQLPSPVMLLDEDETVL